MNEVDRYLAVVLRNIHASAGERQRIETDLRAHFEAAEGAGETVESVIARMGSPVEVAVEFMSQLELPYASFWRRLVAFVIDLGMVMLTDCLPDVVAEQRWPNNVHVWGAWCWLFGQRRRLVTPIPAKGCLGLWAFNLPDDAEFYPEI